MKVKWIVLVVICSLAVACGGEKVTLPDGDGGMSGTSEESPADSEEEEVDPMLNLGIGPISSVDLGELDDALAATGKELFESKCSACHKAEKRYIGPAMAGVTERRSPEWIMNMILNPEGMVAEDPIAKNLLMEYSLPMANQSLTEEEARNILEFFRTI